MAGLEAPGAPTAGKRAQQVQTSVTAAWTAYVAGGARSADAHVDRALARLVDIGSWTTLQMEKGTLTTSQGAAVQALIDRIEEGLSSFPAPS
ncbi:hypothetical protein AB0E04_45630 [Streptomyces sp. NPDC048251]|uniref:hypothetical protein n=1 Tax=Streptomyces sp. NPDC048251 TaxID=3154501 RepID=UPI00341BD495